MRINLFSLKKISFLLFFIFLLQNQFVKASELKSEAKELSQLWESAIKNNRNRDHYAALEDYTKALKIQPKNHFLFYNRGLTYANLQLLTQAINDFERAIKIKSDFGPAYGDRGMAFYELDQKDKACKDFKKAADLKYKRAISWIEDKNRSAWCTQN